ncbi:MAG: hypothetical protein WC503_05730 [Candidatus Shapirobacteria bacterium]
MKKINIKESLNVVTIVLLVVVSSAAFFGGIKYQQNKVPKINQDSRFTTDNPFNGRNQNNRNGGTQTGTTQTGIGQKRMGSNQTLGEIINVDSKSITVKSNDGNSRIILLSDKTTVNKAMVAQISDLKMGEKVIVFGIPNTDGSISGSNIQLNPSMPNVPSGTPSGSQIKTN